MRYLHEKLQDKYVSITDTERECLRESFKQSMIGYDKINIHTELVGGDEYSIFAWKEVVGSEEDAPALPTTMVPTACA